MNLEEKKIKRTDIFVNPLNKEWWYTGCFDKNRNLYFSFYFIRTPFLDSFNFTLFDLKEKKPFVFNKKFFLKKDQEKNQLDLYKKSKGLFISYLGDENHGWSFRFEKKGITVHLKIKPTEPCFTKFDNYFFNQYSMLHFIRNQVNGRISLNNKIYEISNALGYYDHCFGKVPRKTAWHWIAVQNEDIALVSLVNYGAYAQKYTQVLFKTSDHKRSDWVRLNQDVSFEYTSDSKDREWNATSCDMDLKINNLMVSKSREVIPPITPFFINVQHDEYFIEASGKIKIDNQWINTGVMHGVLEEHFGKW
ncbi:MAG: hypothetical protein ABRQ25_07005 [Clostridiaceae bacterium]